MSDQFVGEIRAVSFNYAPQGWALCNGQTLSIRQNTALFSLLGTAFGGDGTSTFGLPNLQGRVALGMGSGPGLTSYAIGNQAGVASVTLTTAQLAPHGHTAIADSGRISATQGSPGGGAWGNPTTGDTPYSSSSPTVTLSANSTTQAGGGGAHNNMMPYTVVNFVIALQGLYPQRS